MIEKIYQQADLLSRSDLHQELKSALKDLKSFYLRRVFLNLLSNWPEGANFFEIFGGHTKSEQVQSFGDIMKDVMTEAILTSQ